MMKNILWFSRHTMTTKQFEALKKIYGDFKIHQVDGTAPNVHVPFEAKITHEGENTVLDTVMPLKKLVQGYDVVAAVFPINLKQQILPFMGDTPLIEAVSARVEDGLTEDGETKYKFVFQHWQKIVKVDVVVEKL